MTTESKNDQPEAWMAVPQAQLEAILQYVQKRPFEEVAGLLVPLRMREVQIVELPQEGEKKE